MSANETNLKTLANNAHILLYEMAEVSLVLSTCLRLADDCMAKDDPKFRYSIDHGVAAVLEWLRERANTSADALGEVL